MQSNTCGEMYSEWAELELEEKVEANVLERFSAATGKAVAGGIVRELVSSTSDTPITICSDQELRWVMQVISYGLTLSFNTEYDTVRDCVKLYSWWLSCLGREPVPAVPRPILEQPTMYVPRIIDHLHALFLPRLDSSDARIMRQAKECHYVLRCLQSLVLETRAELQDQIWPQVLRFLLRINHQLLSIPFEPDDVSVQLCERVLGVLLELWLQACASRHFPSPSYWKTFHALCQTWRHRPAVIDHWVSVTLVLTTRLLTTLYGDLCRVRLTEHQSKLVPEQMGLEQLEQTWFRVFYLLGSPSDVARGGVLSSQFRETTARLGLSEPSEHPCLSLLPYCFYRAMSGIGLVVDCFLGANVNAEFLGADKLIRDWTDVIRFSSQPTQVTPSPAASAPAALIKMTLGFPAVGQKPKDGTGTKSSQAKPIIVSHLPASTLVYSCLKGRQLLASDENLRRTPETPTVNQILDLLGEWLFSAASLSSQNSSEDSISVKSSSSQSDESNKMTDLLGVSGLQAGKAEAVAALCRIFCSKSSGDVDIAEPYLVKFISVLAAVLSQRESLVMSALMFTGKDLFRLDLKGMDLLVPNFLDAIFVLISDSDRQQLHPSVKNSRLFRSCLSICSSLISLPTFYGTSAVNDLSHSTEHHTFIGLRSKLLKILLHSLKHENDSHNLQMTLYLCSLFCHEITHWEHRKHQIHSQDYCQEAVRRVVETICEQITGRLATEFATCVAALDVLASFAAIPSAMLPEGLTELPAALVRALCGFVEMQLSRPPPAHSRDLHSTVVAALNCLHTWIAVLPRLMEDEECLRHVVDTVELGILGSKGQTHGNHSQKKPASQRVHDAAEQLFYCLFDVPPEEMQVEDEALALKHLAPKGASDADRRFRYFLLDRHSIIGMLELPGADCPSLAMVVRSPSCPSKCWQFGLRPRAAGTKKGPDWVPRPEGVQPLLSSPPVLPCFPSQVEKVPKCKIDLNAPSIRVSAEAEKIIPLIRESVQKEKWLSAKSEHLGTRDVKPVPSSTECQIGKILLQDLGYLELENVENDCSLLDSELPDFLTDLNTMVDACPSRSLLTVHLFYMRAGQTDPSDILHNGMALDSTCPGFCRFLAKLGVGVEVASHPHWTGHWSTAFDGRQGSATVSEEADGFLVDGLSHLLHWTAPSTEVAFLVPSARSWKLASGSRAQSSPPSVKYSGDAPVRPPRSKSLTQENEIKKTTPEPAKPKKAIAPHQDFQVLVVWLERFEDHASFPLKELLPTTETGERAAEHPCVLFISQLRSGLCRIKTSGLDSKLGFPGPLTDGVVLDESLLPRATQQTLLSLRLRRALEQEGSCLPHVRRKLRIQEFGQKYGMKISGPEFLQKLIAP